MDKRMWPLIFFLVGVGVTLTGLINITIGYLCLVLAAILFIYQVIGLWKRILSKQYPWVLPLIIGVVLLISPFIVHTLTNKSPQAVKGELHAILPPLSMQVIGTVGEPSKISWIVLTLTFAAGCAILLLYYRAKKGIWPFRNKGIIHKRLIAQELYDELDSIAKDKWHNSNYESIGPAINLLTEWKDRAKRILFNLFGQAELNNFIDKIRFVEKNDEYRNSSIGMIGAFYNEKEIYLKYLEDLLDSLEKYPELWGS